MKRLLKAVLILVAAVMLAFAGFVAVVSITDYRPAPVEDVDVDNQRSGVLDADREFAITTFNIGYCGLDKETDFFMDGGTMSRAISKEHVLASLDGVLRFLQGANSDFFFIQEIDRRSTRSYNVDEYDAVTKSVPEYAASFAANYKVGWVPVPVMRPHGRVLGGLATLSRFEAARSRRFSLPGVYSWPTQLFMLDRCLLESRIPLTSGRELVLAHLHLEAYDKGGTIRDQQLGFVKDYAEAELEKGNYVVIGGDWNHMLSENAEEKRAAAGDSWPSWLQTLPDDFTPDGYAWAYDESTPSNRGVDAPYDPGRSFLVTIDGFLVSNNIEIVSVHGHDLGFEYSDHNPVTAVLKLKERSH
ncbi:MAG: endonuclease/exonuclease/phosphatase family protein [Clostridia bacterium]|nr:endonuclease/exonuclease/phosphatase family protein [Clostridia bacterium]